jgi:hypothetical protein
MRPNAAAFLPLTLGAITEVRAARPGTPGLDVAARRAERLACDAWRALLREGERSPSTEFTTGLRRLSLAVGVFIGDDWSSSACRGHRDRIARYQWWLEEAFADGNGAEFAEAFARYDDALGRTIASGAVSRVTDLTTDEARDRAAGGVLDAPGAGSLSGAGRVAAISVRPSGTMAGWARQARAATSRAVSPLRWATSRHATSSSRWSRH